ncbi:MAG TPA: ZIP family metal transporter [Pirellulales bacterium]
MDRGWLLVVYCLLIMVASLAGGWLPLLFRLSHTGMQLSMSFVGGAMIGVGLLHLLPHAFFELQDIYPCVWWLLGGFLSMFFIERVFHFHHHDVPPDENELAAAGAHGHQHGHAHAHGHAHGPDCDHSGDKPHAWRAALAGLALHSATDGVALAAAVSADIDADGAGVALAGLAVFLVVCLHKPFDSLTLGTLMAVGGQSKRARHVVNFLYALAVPIGVSVFLLGVNVEPGTQRQIIGAALAFAAGTFLCISTSDLLPELQFHAHDRLKLSAALLAGLALSAAIVVAESSMHDHGAHAPTGKDSHEEHDHDHAAESHDHAH